MSPSFNITLFMIDGFEPNQNGKCSRFVKVKSLWWRMTKGWRVIRRPIEYFARVAVWVCVEPDQH